MAIEIVRSIIQFKNPRIGQPTRAVADHYYARRITAKVNDEERSFRFMADELPFDVEEEDMTEAIERKMNIEANAN